jgi:hypothetical protein
MSGQGIRVQWFKTTGRNQGDYIDRIEARNIADTKTRALDWLGSENPLAKAECRLRLRTPSLNFYCGDQALSEMSTALPYGEGILSALPRTVHMESGKPRQSRLPCRDNSSAFPTDLVLAASFSGCVYQIA